MTLRTPAETSRQTAIEQAVDETVKLFHRLRIAATEMHGGGELAAGKCGVLQSLAVGGPQTVPRMARERPVSRQHIQTLVDSLSADGYVELVVNPHHRRSKLVRLTPTGRKLIATINRREARVFAQLNAQFDAVKVRRAADTLASLRHFLEGSAWQALLVDRVAARRKKSAKTCRSAPRRHETRHQT
jgi:DNA-binding MarR family transcriptional regulator